MSVGYRGLNVWLVSYGPNMTVYNKRSCSYSGLVNLGGIFESDDSSIRSTVSMIIRMFREVIKLISYRII